MPLKLFMDDGRQQIIMTYDRAPSLEDRYILATEILENLPEELHSLGQECCIRVEDFPEEMLEHDLELNDPFELLSLYDDGKEISPGVESKTIDPQQTLILFRRPILDTWCETGENLKQLIAHIIAIELAHAQGYSDQEADSIVSRYFVPDAA